jgi:hypothetical protein
MNPGFGIGRIGRYEILEEIGRGGMAIVYRGLDLELHREVAIKVLPSATGCRCFRSRVVFGRPDEGRISEATAVSDPRCRMEAKPNDR